MEQSNIYCTIKNSQCALESTKSISALSSIGLKDYEATKYEE